MSQGGAGYFPAEHAAVLEENNVLRAEIDRLRAALQREVALIDWHNARLASGGPCPGGLAVLEDSDELAGRGDAP